MKTTRKLRLEGDQKIAKELGVRKDWHEPDDDMAVKECKKLKKWYL